MTDTLMDRIDDHPLADEIRTRYLNYSLSVITARALPDVRDGLKPSQRRILVAMNDLRLRPDAKHRKCSKICGDTSGNYHPHGDAAIYTTLVRMGQWWSMRNPLVDPQGNFGSIAGDNPAAMRYTEARLTPIAMELLSELGSNTVDFRDNYDATKEEPVVLPARFPNLLVNGSSGIAVGMATSIPPHNLREVTDALLALMENPDAESDALADIVGGPDFPTGATILSSREDIRKVYAEGHGPIKVRGEHEIERGSRGKKFVVITSIPYGVNMSSLIEKIGSHIAEKKVPQLIDVRDESSEEAPVRIVCELKKDADPDLAVAYLCRHTELQSNFNVNLNCLVPTESGVLRPERLGLKGALQAFLDFRFEVVERRLRHELAQLEKRIHQLEGLVKILDDLDEALRIIRASDGKADAARGLMARFDIDAEQADYVLERKLFHLSRMEIESIREELAELQKKARRIRGILKSRARMSELIAAELQEVADEHGDERRTAFAGDDEEASVPDFDPDAYIVREDAYVVLTKDGRVKRQGSIKSVDTIRVREGDEVIAIVAGSTASEVAFYSNLGSVYVCRIADVPATTGHGEPIQKLFRFGDGERALTAYSLDERFVPPPPAELQSDDPEGAHLLVVTKMGYGFRLGLAPAGETTKKGGKRYAKVMDDDEVLGVQVVPDMEAAVVSASADGRVLLCPAADISYLSGPGRGVIVHKLADGDEVIGFDMVVLESDGVVVEKTTGGTARISAARYRVTGRAGRGFELAKRGGLLRVIPRPVLVPDMEPSD